jgi:hypothetical protein
MSFPSAPSWQRAFEHYKRVKEQHASEQPARYKAANDAYQAAVFELARIRGYHGKSFDKAFDAVTAEAVKAIREEYAKPYENWVGSMLEEEKHWRAERRRLARKELLSFPEERSQWLLFKSIGDSHRSCDSGTGRYCEIEATLYTEKLLRLGFEAKHQRERYADKELSSREVLVLACDERDVAVAEDLYDLPVREVIRRILKLGGNPGVLFRGMPTYDLDTRWGLTWWGEDVKGWKGASDDEAGKLAV